MTKKIVETAALRPLGLDDLPHISEWFWNLADVSIFDRTTPLPTSKEAVIDSWKAALSQSDPPKAMWFIAVTPKGERLGIGGLQSINYIHGDAVLPMFISPAARRKGLATAITCRMMDVAFRHLRLHRVTTFYREDNAVTQHVLAKLGFLDEGRQREAWYADGTRWDIVHSGLLAADWLERRDSALLELEHSGAMRLEMTGETDV